MTLTNLITDGENPCVSCRWFRLNFTDGQSHAAVRCMHDNTLHHFALINRTCEGDKCGPEGKLFSQRKGHSNA